jgi:hypothetical protein
MPRLLNVSYDPTRELYKAVNEAFIKDWRGIRFSPQRLYHFILYTGVFLVELVRARTQSSALRDPFTPTTHAKYAAGPAPC